ncbi:MAG: hypothetical protein ABIJ96_01280 [Elusimicrobiota bacterium]
MRWPACISALLLVVAVSAAPAQGGNKRAKKSGSPAAPSPKAAADKDTVKLVEYFIKADTSELDPTLIPRFMAIDPGSLPLKLRVQHRAKKAELEALRKISANRRKAPIRRAGQEAPSPAECEPEKGTLQYVKMMTQMGFEEISDDELNHLMQRTRCSECELMVESSLKVTLVPTGKKNGLVRYNFLSANDPWMAIIAAYRNTGSGGGTNFFGSFNGACH